MLRFTKYEILEDRCKDCGTCLEECPEGAIKRTEKDICEIDEERCSYCGICMDVCELKAVKKTFNISTFLKSLKKSKENGGRSHAHKE